MIMWDASRFHKDVDGFQYARPTVGRKSFGKRCKTPRNNSKNLTKEWRPEEPRNESLSCVRKIRSKVESFRLGNRNSQRD